jgi:hypothetical protein
VILIRDHIKSNVLKTAVNNLNDKVNPYNYIENATKTKKKNYWTLSRRLCYNWNLNNMSKIDDYYLNKDYIKMMMCTLLS